MKRTLVVLLGSLVVILLFSFRHWLLGLVSLFFLIPLFKKGIWQSGLLGFLIVFLVWFGAALVLSHRNDHLLANQIGEMLGGMSGIVLALLTGVVGGIAGALVATLSSMILNPFFSGDSSDKFGIG